MADDVYTTLLDFVSDSTEANRDIKDTTENLKKMEEQAGKVAKVNLGQGISFPGDELSKDFALFTKAFDQTFVRVKDKLVDLRTDTGAAAADLRKFAGSSTEDLKKIAYGAENLDIERIKAAALKAGQAISDELAAGLATGELTDADLIEIQAINEQMDKIEELEEKRKNEVKEAVEASRIKSSLYTSEAQLLSNQATAIQRNAQLLRNQSQQLQQVSQVGLGVGVGIVGGIFGFASKYVNDAKEATSVTVAWKEAQESLGESGQKIGATFAQEALPLLQKAAETAEKAAAFVEKHPEIVRAALNAGLVIAGLSAVGLAVSKGIKLYADQLYLSSIPLQLQAGQLQASAAKEQLIAARLRAGQKVDLDVPAPVSTQRPVAGGNVLGTLAKVTLIATSVIIGAELGLALGNAIAKLLDPNAKDMTRQEVLFFGGVRAIEAIQQKFNNMLIEVSSKMPDLFGGRTLRSLGQLSNQGLQQVDAFFKELLLGTDELASATEKLQGVRGSGQFEAVLKAYEDYKRDDLALVQRHHAERAKTISDALKAEAKENEEYARNTARVRAQLSRSIAEATRSYEEQSRQAEEQNAQERARIIRDGGIEIQRIEENLQESLRKLRLGHEDRLDELVAARDALGIVKENQRYNRERAEEIRQSNLEIRQRRADLAIRLQDLQQNFQQERAERFNEFQARLTEIRANAQEQLKELAARHREELNEIRNNRIERLRELDDQLREERSRRHEYFLDQIRNLDAALLGEAELRKRRQDEMIAELDRFLLAYQSGLSRLHTTPTNRAAGGYATYGTYLLGDSAGGGRGKAEYVLGGNLTELAERVLGGRLTQERMAALFGSMSGGNNKNVVYNDNRRLNSQISAADRNRMVDDSLEAFGTLLEGI